MFFKTKDYLLVTLNLIFFYLFFQNPKSYISIFGFIFSLLANINNLKLIYLNLLMITIIFIQLVFIKKEINKLYNPIRDYIKSYISKIPNFNLQKYLLLILFNIKDNSLDIYYQSINIGIVHYFVVSGFHFEKIKLFFQKLKAPMLLILLTLGLYIYTLNFSPSSLRAFLFIFLKEVNNKEKNSINTLFVSSWISIALNPHFVVNLGFIMSYFLTLLIICFNKIKFFKSKFWLNNLILWLFLIPINLYVNKEINFTSYFYSFIFYFLIDYIYLIGWISLFTWDLGIWFFVKFDSLLSFFSDYVIKIKFFKIESYYFLILLFAFLVFIIIIKIWNYSMVKMHIPYFRT